MLDINNRTRKLLSHSSFVLAAWFYSQRGEPSFKPWVLLQRILKPIVGLNLLQYHPVLPLELLFYSFGGCFLRACTFLGVNGKAKVNCVKLLQFHHTHHFNLHVLTELPWI